MFYSFIYAGLITNFFSCFFLPFLVFTVFIYMSFFVHFSPISSFPLFFLRSSSFMFVFAYHCFVSLDLPFLSVYLVSILSSCVYLFTCFSPTFLFFIHFIVLLFVPLFQVFVFCAICDAVPYPLNSFVFFCFAFNLCSFFHFLFYTFISLPSWCSFRSLLCTYFFKFLSLLYANSHLILTSILTLPLTVNLSLWISRRGCYRKRWLHSQCSRL